MASVTDGHGALTGEEKGKPVRVQWDPERGPRMGVKPYRSIQIGISRSISQKWAEEWIESIEDVTEMAGRLRECVEKEEIAEEELVRRGAMPVERVYDVPEELRVVLKMGER
jgi:hypothetical protein